MTLQDFPAINAMLNAASAAFLTAGYVFIKLNRWRAHGVAMIAATVTSSIFLTFYLIYHFQVAPKSLGLPPSLFRSTYFVILFSHTVLAVVILPLVLLSLWRAYRRRWEQHRRISVITLPLWFYVSVTGVIIYWMLYHVAGMKT